MNMNKLAALAGKGKASGAIPGMPPIPGMPGPGALGALGALGGPGAAPGAGAPGAGAPAPEIQVTAGQKKSAVIEEVCNIVKGQKNIIEDEFKRNIKGFFEKILKAPDNTLGDKFTKLSQDVIQYEIKSSLLDNYFVQHQMIIILYGELGATILNSYFNENLKKKSDLSKLSSGKILDELLNKLSYKEEEEEEKVGGQGSVEPQAAQNATNQQNVMQGGSKKNDSKKNDSRMVLQKGGAEPATSLEQLLRYFPADENAKHFNSKMAYIIEKSISDAVRETLQSEDIKILIHTQIEGHVKKYMSEIIQKFAGEDTNANSMKLKKMMLYTLLHKKVLRRRFRNAIVKAIELCIAKTDANALTDTVVSNMINSMIEQVQIFFSGKKSGGNAEGTGITGVIGKNIDQDGGQGAFTPPTTNSVGDLRTASLFKVERPNGRSDRRSPVGTEGSNLEHRRCSEETFGKTKGKKTKGKKTKKRKTKGRKTKTPTRRL